MADTFILKCAQKIAKHSQVLHCLEQQAAQWRKIKERGYLYSWLEEQQGLQESPKHVSHY